MRGWKKFRIAGLLLIILLSAVFMFFLSTRRRAVQFADGSSLEWLGTTQGTNTFIEGSLLEKLFQNHIPAQGFDFSGIRLRKPRFLYPQADADVICWIRLRSPALRASDFAYYWEGSRVTASNRSGRSFANPPARPNRISSNEVILAVPLYAFPRNERKAFLSLTPPKQTVDPPRAATFEFDNPFQAPAQKWEVQPLPATNNYKDLTVVLESVHIGTETTLEFKLSSPNWHLAESRTRDEENNTVSWSRSTDASETVIQEGFEYSLESNKTWRVDGTFVGVHDFHKPEPKQFGKDEQRILEISSTGPQVRLTNSIGEIYIWNFNGHELSTRRESGNDRPYWVVLSTTNEMNKPVIWSGGSAWSGWFRGPQTQMWWIDKPSSSSNLTLQVASPRVVHATFYINPTKK